MKSKQLFAILLCAVLLFGALVPAVSAETVTDRAGEWQPGDGWSDAPVFRFNNYGKDTLTFTNPTAATETDGNWSVSADVLFDSSIATPDQRFVLELYMASGDVYYVTVQRRFADKNLRTALAIKPNSVSSRSVVKFNLSGDQGTVDMESGAKNDLWFQILPAEKVAAMRAETSFRVAVDYTDGTFRLSFHTLDGVHLFTLTAPSSESTVAKANRISKINVLPDVNAASTNYWDIANLTVTGAAGVNPATADAKNYAIGNGWECRNGFELSYTNKQNDKRAVWKGSIPENTEFSVQYDLTHTELTYSDLTDTTDRALNAMTQFSVGGDTVLLRVARRYNSKRWKNYFTVEVMKQGTTKWEKVLDQWVNTPEYTGYRIRMERNEEGFLTYNIFSLTGKLLVNFYDEKSGAHTGAVTNFSLHGQNGYGKWKCSNLSLTVGDPAVPDARFTEPVMWSLSSGWYARNGSMLIDSTGKDNTVCRLLTNAQGTFTMSYDVNFLTSALDTASNMSFRLAGKVFRLCIERVKIEGTWKNRMTVFVDGETAITQTTEAASSQVSVTVKHDHPTSGNNLRMALAFADGSKLSWGTTEEALGLTAGAFDGLLSEWTFTGAENNGIYGVSLLRLNVTRDTTSAFRFVGVQNTAIDASGETPKTDVRLIGVLDSLDYEAIGMDVLGFLGAADETPDRTFRKEAKTVYGSILASADGSARRITASELGGSYIWALTVCGVPAEGTVTLAVSLYTVKDGTKTATGTYEVVFTDGVYVSAARR